MASDLEYVGYIMEQLSLAGEIRSRKMFGEFALYYDGVYFGGVMDNRFLVKITEGGKALIPNFQTELPYAGGKPMLFIEELEDREFLADLVRTTVRELPPPKPKKRKVKPPVKAKTEE